MNHIEEHPESNPIDIPCDCGSFKAYWEGELKRVYACESCHIAMGTEEGGKNYA